MAVRLILFMPFLSPVNLALPHFVAFRVVNKYAFCYDCYVFPHCFSLYAISLALNFFILLQTQPPPDFLLTQEDIPHDQSLSVFKDMSWTASLPFKGHFCLETDLFSESLESEYDLFEFTTSMYKGCKHIIRFNPTVYPIAGGFESGCGGHRLVTDLLHAAKSVGNCTLFSNGRGSNASAAKNRQVECLKQRVLKCSHYRKYLHPILDAEDIRTSQFQLTGSDNTYRVTTYSCDKKNSRVAGLSSKRRTSTLRHTSATCRAKFTLRLDDNSFFFVCGIGDNQHTGHPPLHSNELKNRKRFLDPSAMENVAAMSVANIQPAQAALFTKTRTGLLFTRHQIAYVQGFTRMADELLKDVDSTPEMSSDSSPANKMLSYLRKCGAYYVCLYHNGRTVELRGQTPKAARIEVQHDDVSNVLTSHSIIATDNASTDDIEISPPMKFRLLCHYKWQNPMPSRSMHVKAD